MTLISANNCTIGYGARTLCRDITFTVEQGACVLLCGANGSGKSTLLRAIAEGALKDTSKAAERGALKETGRGTGNGSLKDRQNGGNMSAEGVMIAMVPTQIPKVKGFTLREFVSTSLYTESSWSGRVGRELDERIGEALRLLGLAELEDRDIATLSDGEFQKGTIAAALCKAPGGVVLLDEPTAFLDPENKIAVFRTLLEISESTGTAFVYSTHDIAAALPYCTEAWAIGRDGLFRSAKTS